MKKSKKHIAYLTAISGLSILLVGFISQKTQVDKYLDNPHLYEKLSDFELYAANHQILGLYIVGGIVLGVGVTIYVAFLISDWRLKHSAKEQKDN